MPMTLLGAFRACAPPVSDADVDAVRTEALGVIYEELQHLSRRVAGRREDLDDAVTTVALRLVQAGPRGIRVNDPSCESGVRGYLVNALKHAVSDLRVSPAHRSIDADPTGEDELRDSCQPDPEAEAMRVQREAEEAEAHRQLFEDIVPSIAAELRADAQADFVRSIEILRLIGDGSVTVDEFVNSQHRSPDKPSADAFYQRMSRARRRLAEGVERRIVAWSCSHERAIALRAIVSRLRRKSV